MAELVSSRRFGIGSDGLILIKPSDLADFKMEMYNAGWLQGSHVRKRYTLCGKICL